MKSEELRSLQAPLEERYKDSLSSTSITLKAQERIGEDITCNIETGRAMLGAGLPEATGGTGLSVCSGDMLLEALVASAGATLNAGATAIGVGLRDGIICAEGDIDFRGTLAVSKDTPVGFQNIRLYLDLDTDATEDHIASLKKLTGRYCLVFQTLQHSPTIETTYSTS